MPHSSSQPSSHRRADATAAANGLSDADHANVEETLRASISRGIRDKRQSERLSVRELAARVGVSGSMISQIEAGTVMPSVATVVKLAAALGTQVGTLFNQREVTGQVIRGDDRPAFDYPDKKLRDEMISSDPTRRLEAMVTVLQPGGGTGPELFTHGAEVEMCLVLKGKVDLILDERRLRLSRGDCATFSGDIPHGISNPTSRVAEVLFVVTPATY